MLTRSRFTLILSLRLVLLVCRRRARRPARARPRRRRRTGSHDDRRRGLTTAVAPPRPPGKITHVFVINLENENYAHSWGRSRRRSTSTARCVKKGELLTQYFGIGHVSLDNYIAQISGPGAEPADAGRLPELLRLRVDRHRPVPTRAR